MLVIILATTIISNRDKLLIRSEMDGLVGSNNWNVDLEDEDKILRITVKSNVLPDVFQLLKKHRLRGYLLNIYDTNLGVDCPLLKDYQ